MKRVEAEGVVCFNPTSKSPASDVEDDSESGEFKMANPIIPDKAGNRASSEPTSSTRRCLYVPAQIEIVALQSLNHTGRPVDPERLEQHWARRQARIADELTGGGALTIEFLDRQLLSLTMNGYWHPRRGQADRHRAIGLAYRILGTSIHARSCTREHSKW